MSGYTIATEQQITYFSSEQESQIFDRKSSSIKIGKLSQTVSAMANSDGGEIIVGVEDDGIINGFPSIEDANGLLSAVSESLRTEYYNFEFIQDIESKSFILSLNLQRHPMVVSSTAGNVYIRNGAQNQILEGERLEALRRSRTDTSFESSLTRCTVDAITNSEALLTLLLAGKAFSEPDAFLQKNGLTKDNRASVAAVVLFADDPSDYIPNAAVKVYRYSTSSEEDRAHLEGTPETLSGPIYDLIPKVKARVVELVESIPRLDSTTGLTEISYPPEALHEILVNAFLHRDYGMKDYVHVRIFDNRIEVDSPGRLHGHVTVANILTERSARNPLIQKVINKFPDAPNMDIGEGLNTAFRAMERLRLAPPIIEELSDRVRVTIKHEPLASPAQAIIEYLSTHTSINNSQAREITKIPQERTIRRIFEQLLESGEITRSGRSRGTYYQLANKSHE